MKLSIARWAALAVVLLGAVQLAAGGDAETDARDKFKALQSAIKAKDSAKIWALVSSDTQAAANKVAKGLQDKYAKADAAGKKQLEDSVVLPGAVLAKMTGQDYFKAKVFDEKYGEVADSKVDKVVVKGDKATVSYTEPDNDKRTLTFVRENNQWKAELKIVRAD